MGEIWKDVEGYENYKISTFGKVYSKYRNRLLKGALCRDGYYKVWLYGNIKPKPISVHRLVALNFLKHVEGKEYVNHLDENKLNNNVDNLEWCSIAENNAYGTRNERAGKTMKTSETLKKGVLKRAKTKSIPIYSVHISTGETNYYTSIREAGDNGYRPGEISKCINGLRKTHAKHKWFKQ